MSDQFNQKRFSRGVFLTGDHAYGVLRDIRDAAADQAVMVEGQRDDLGVSHVQWTLPFVDAPVDTQTTIDIPWLVPPFLQWAGTLTFKDRYFATIRELSLSWDQRAERFGIVGPQSHGQGDLTNADMSRYDMTLTLYERTRSTYSGGDETSTGTPIFTVEIKGEDAFGNAFQRSNPLLIEDLNISLKPYSVYHWLVSIPRLSVTEGTSTNAVWNSTVSQPYVKDGLVVRVSRPPNTNVWVASATATAADMIQAIVDRINLWGPLVLGETVFAEFNFTPYSHVVVGGDTPLSVATDLASQAVAGSVTILGIATLSVGAATYGHTIGLTDSAVDIANGVLADIAGAGGDPFYTFSLTVGLTIEGVAIAAGSGAPPISSTVVDGNCEFDSVNVTPGADPTVNQLAMPSFTLRAKLLSPLTERDSADGGTTVQNIPTAHLGNRTGTTFTVNTPAGNALINGNTDLRDSTAPFDLALREGAKGGYGSGFGAMQEPMQATNAPPTALLLNDAHYHVIAVPMWQGLGTVKRGDISKLPYLDGDDTRPTLDQRIIPVPDNFCLHWAFAISSLIGGTANNSVTMRDEVGISIASGWRADSYLFQQVAYGDWPSPVGTADGLVDRLQDVYEVVNVFVVNREPFFMGKGNQVTQDRSNVGFDPPATLGREQVAVIRWSKQDTGGMFDEGSDQLVIGRGGCWVLLCGKLTTGA